MKKLFLAVMAVFFLAAAFFIFACNGVCATQSFFAKAEKPKLQDSDKNLLEPEISIQCFPLGNRFVVDIAITDICQDTDVLFYDNERRICRVSPQCVFGKDQTRPEQNSSCIKYTIEYRKKSDVGIHQIYIQFANRRYHDCAATIRVPEFDFILADVIKPCGEDAVSLEFQFYPLFGAEFGENETVSLSIESENGIIMFPDVRLKPGSDGLYYGHVEINYHDYIEDLNGNLKTSAEMDSCKTEKKLLYFAPNLCFADLVTIDKTSPDLALTPGKDKKIASFRIINEYHKILELVSFDVAIEASLGCQTISNIRVRRLPETKKYDPGGINLVLPLGASEFGVFADISGPEKGNSVKFKIKDFIFRDPLTGGQLLALDAKLEY